MRVRILIAAVLVALGAGLGLSGCRKNEIQEIVNQGYLPPFTLPDSLTLTYGQRVQLDLPAEYQGLQHVALAFSFKNNPKVKLTANDSLTTMLAEAVTIDPATRRVSLDASKLYPTNMLSATTGLRTPATYQATLTATSDVGFKPVESAIKIRVVPAQLNIAELPTADKIPYGYGIYDKKPLAYTIDYVGLNATNTALALHVNGRPDGKISLAGQQVVVAADAGDPAQKSEWIYDLIPSLTKDGYAVANRQFRVVLMPKPKFFFGTYYSEYDLTVLENRVVVRLGMAYTSKAPAFFPDKYKGTYRLKGIEKDGAAYTDFSQVFSVDAATGKVSVALNPVLAVGSYKVTVQTQATTGLLLETALTLVME